MYKDLFGKNQEYVEEQLHDKIAEKFTKTEERIRYKIRKTLFITFYIVQNKVKKIGFAYSEEVSPERVIAEIGYEFSECNKVTETDYRISTCVGVRIINIYNTHEGTHAFLQNLE